MQFRHCCCPLVVNYGLQDIALLSIQHPQPLIPWWYDPSFHQLLACFLKGKCEPGAASYLPSGRIREKPVGLPNLALTTYQDGSILEALYPGVWIPLMTTTVEHFLRQMVCRPAKKECLPVSQWQIQSVDWFSCPCRDAQQCLLNLYTGNTTRQQSRNHRMTCYT